MIPSIDQFLVLMIGDSNGGDDLDPPARCKQFEILPELHIDSDTSHVLPDCFCRTLQRTTILVVFNNALLT